MINTYVVDCAIKYEHNGKKKRTTICSVFVAAINKENAVLKAINFYSDSRNTARALNISNVTKSTVIAISNIRKDRTL